MRDERRDNYRDEREPRWLHGHHSGQRSDRGNYNIDTHFNRGYGSNAASQYGDQASFNSNADQEQMYPQGRFQSGGAHYSGEDYAQGGSRGPGNQYGVTFIGDEYNSGRHYDARADYSDRDYDDLRRQGRQDYRYGMADERFGHDVRRGNDSGNWARGSRGDYESYRRYEHNNPNYDNDYTTGFAGRNYTRGVDHYGEDSRYSNMERWRGESDQRHDRYMRDRDRR
ncbi:MAG: hypothetical protein LPK07_02545 [Hymenobacteraceae bacterium]|nr:hypothetical protein [Hymenobacteraceae bacterium]MDX5421473.1 hypothetical protein [Hymenobacteraceae bacterium]MDX5480539.1 hypothetical protein [Hymenobacteraceae bacterium]